MPPEAQSGAVERPALAGAPAGARGARRSGRLAALALALALAAAVRCWPAAEVLGGPRVRLGGDGDAVYHVVRAQRAAAEWPRVPWTDPGLDHPAGALIPWPPLQDAVVATVAVLTPGGADPEHVARVAALLPLVLALLAVPLLASLARGLLGGDGVLEALVASLLPAAAQYGFVGVSDHHAAELLLLCAVLAAHHRAWAAGRLRVGWALAAGAGLALAFWNWPGSGLYPGLLALHAAVNHAVQPEGAAAARRVSLALAIAAGAAAVALAGSIAWLGPPGALRSMAIVSIGGLSVALCAGVALGASALALAARPGGSGDGEALLPLRRRRGDLVHPRAGPSAGRASSGGASARSGGLPGRLAAIAAAGLVAASALAAVPGIRAGVRHGLTALEAGNGWYRSIAEFKPALFSGIYPLAGELLGIVAFYGLALAALPVAAWALAGRWRRDGSGRQGLLLLAVWCGVLVPLALARMRFMLYASAPVGICAALALRRLAEGIAPRRRPWAVGAGVAALVGPAYLCLAPPGPAVLPAVAAAAEWVGRAAPARPDATGVLAPWSMGHALRAAGRPVIASPFGTDVSRASLVDEATFFSTASTDEAEAIALRRRVGFVVVRSPITSVASVQGFRADGAGAGAGAAPLVVEEPSVLHGITRRPTAEFTRSTMARLFYGDGLAPRRVDEPALGWARLLREELPATASGAPPPEQVKTFGVVAGAVLRLEGFPAGRRVTVTARIRTNAGRVLEWRSFATSGARGAAIRVPFATGWNGEVEASPYVASDGHATVQRSVSEEDVRLGREVRAAP